MENPQTWNDAEKAIYGAWTDFKRSGDAGPSLVRRIYAKLLEKGFIADQNEEILGLDHVAVLVWDIELWTKRYAAFGARVVYDNSDMSPSSPSSAKLRGLRWGNLLIALLEPINREEESQVYHALQKHGDHFFQHVALRVRDIRKLKQKMEASGANFLGDILERSDAFGPVRQIFGQIFDMSLESDEGNFWEFAERSQSGEDSSLRTGEHHDLDNTMADNLYKSVAAAAKSGRRVQFIE